DQFVLRGKPQPIGLLAVRYEKFACGAKEVGAIHAVSVDQNLPGGCVDGGSGRLICRIVHELGRSLLHELSIEIATPLPSMLLYNHYKVGALGLTVRKLPFSDQDGSSCRVTLQAMPASGCPSAAAS